MTSDHLQRVQQVFEDALARAPEERDALLAEACGDDAELRAEVESLLAHDQQAPDDFMQPPEVDPKLRRPSPTLRCAKDGAHKFVPDSSLREGRGAPAPDAPDPLIGERIGNYRIERVIAAGGMGTVYLARQDNPEREVALKVMRAGIASRSALRRFEYESQILARLRHPNIAQVYEAGTANVETGIPSRDREGADQDHAHEDVGMPPARVRVPYFVMEYVPDAATVTDYAEREKLDTRRRLELFAQACEAVHHGHQKGIIHRDLKPGNILVDSTGQVKIIDFGVARSTDADVALTTLRTDVGQLIGTLQYMSPEQCAADPHDLDTRSDVYALGVVLYELVCERLPYDVTGTTIYEAARVIREAAPARPSTIDRALRGDVETIALKALEKDRERRYASAADLAQDIRRYLNREPIEARPPTAWTRALRWTARHPAATTATACLGMAAIIIAATFVSVWYVNVRPHKTWLSDDGREARLLSFAGKILHAWTAEPPSKIKSAELVKLPEQLGGGKLALVAFARTRGSTLPTGLCAYDTADDFSKPVWAKGVRQTEVPTSAPEHDYVGEDFSARICAIVDIFPERPGLEIVAVHQHSPYSQCVIRVYGLDGETLYQVWQDGGVGPCYWMSGPGLLVFQGDNADEYWEARGHPEIRNAHPIVVFAIRPKLGIIVDDFLRSTPGDDPRSPAWYWCLHPIEATDLAYELVLMSPPGEFEPERFVQFGLKVDKDINAWLWWVLDENGHEVEGTRYRTDECVRNMDGLPNPDQFELGPLPPIVSTSGSATKSSQ